MSEEEIIEEIKYNILNDPFTVFSQDSSFESNQIRANAIQGLLDLYQKEKKLKDKIRELIDKRGNNGYTSLDCIEDIEELLEERN